MPSPLLSKARLVSQPWVWAAGLIGGLFVCALAVAGFTGVAGLANLFGGLLQAPNAHSGVLRGAQGIVQIKAADGDWLAAPNGQVVVAGQHVRTGALSGVTLAFYDGSQMQLGPQTEISVDTLDARRVFGPRVILLTQWLGQTKNDVSHSNNAASRYEVTTPAGVGTAKGTSFQVTVFTTLFALTWTRARWPSPTWMSR